MDRCERCILHWLKGLYNGRNFILEWHIRNSPKKSIQAFFATKNDETQGHFLLKTQKFSRNSSIFVKLKNTKNSTLKRSNLGGFYYNLSRFRSFLGLFRRNFNKNCSKSSKLSENFMKFNFVFEKLDCFPETQAKIFEKLKNTKIFKVGCLLKFAKKLVLLLYYSDYVKINSNKYLIQNNCFVVKSKPGNNFSFVNIRYIAL